MNKTTLKRLDKIRSDIEDFKIELEAVKDSEQDVFDSKGERAQESEKGQKQQDLISELESAIESMETVVENLANATAGDD